MSRAKTHNLIVGAPAPHCRRLPFLSSTSLPHSLNQPPFPLWRLFYMLATLKLKYFVMQAPGIISGYTDTRQGEICDQVHELGCIIGGVTQKTYFEPKTISFLRCPYRNRPTQVWPYYRPYTCRTNAYLYGFVHSRGRIQFTRLKSDKLN